ncbi:acyl-CoA dehydrogenase family protein [Aquibacillus sediminis]|uniref:acyl-CoA dehydrogenase family protein n=1 Tax=Aquibacillus sediminis TaxID=2574734 RepID=UPI001FE98DE4|nr:acyl-CoA dehydrogenase family protein [Aquibacillus sediminis]
MSKETVTVREELVNKAHALIPKLRERAEETEELGKMPDATIEDLKRNGIINVFQPKMYGGFQENFRTFTEVTTEIARGCGSTAWFVSLTNIRGFMASYVFGKQALDEIFVKQDAVLAGNFKPITIDMEKVDGGYFIKEAKWPFVSGCRHADWLYFGVPLEDENGEVEMAIIIVPSDEAYIHDDWDVMGLRGSASNSVSLKNVFVPEHRVSLDRLARFGHYTAEELKEIAVYRTPFVPALTLSIVAPALGLAKAAMDLQMKTVERSHIGNTFYNKQSEAAVTHFQIANAQLKIDSAELHLFRAVDMLDNYAAEGKTMTTDEVVRVKADFGYVNQLCKEAIELLVAGAGSRFAYNTNPLQRVYRDFMTMHLHGFITPSSLVETYGRVLCGQEPNTYFL